MQGMPDAVQVRLAVYAWYNKVINAVLNIQKVLDTEEQSSGVSRSKVELQSLSTRNYLDHTVVPILLDAMAVVARERCVTTCMHGRVCLRPSSL